MIAHADELDKWVWRNPRPHGLQINSLARGDGLWTAYGLSGLVATSVDGVDWDLASVGTNAMIFTGTHGNGRFVCASSRGAFHSFDAHNWFKASAFFNINDVAFGNGHFVGPDGNGTVRRSIDGSNWIATTLGPTDHYTRVSFANDRFFLTGSDFSFGNYILQMSTDGTNWTGPFSLGTNGIEKIVYGNGVYLGLFPVASVTLARTELRTSIDGTTWSPPVIMTNHYILDVIFANDRFAAADAYGNVMLSPDATNWTEIAVPELFAVSEIGWADGQYVVAGILPLIATSPDATNWTRRTVGKRNSFLGVIHTNGTYIAVGGNLGDSGADYSESTVAISTNGRDWTEHLSNASNSLAAVTFGGGQYVAVGANGAIVTSTDLTTWTPVASPTSNLLNAIAFGSGRFVAVGGNTNRATIVSSADGLSWTNHTDATNYPDLYSLTYAQDQFVAVGRTNASKVPTTLTSPDGLNWTPRTSAATNNLRAITYGNGSFVAVGDRGAITVSSDGVTWTNRSIPIILSYTSVAYGNGWYVVMAQPVFFFTSTNTADWTLRRSLNPVTSIAANGIAFGGNFFVAVGPYGMILESAPFTPPPPEIGLRLRWTDRPFLSVTGPEWHQYEIQAADSLPPSWQSFNTFSNYSATTTLPVNKLTNPAALYYRVKLLD